MNQQNSIAYNELTEKMHANLIEHAPELVSMAEAAEQAGAADFQNGFCDHFESEDEAAYIYVSSFIEQEGRDDLTE